MPSVAPRPVPPPGYASTHSPTGERLTTCGSCGAQIYFVSGEPHAISLATGRPHQQDCPHARTWARGKRRRTRDRDWG